MLLAGLLTAAGLAAAAGVIAGSNREPAAQPVRIDHERQNRR
ncbi:hypothetical protein [Lactiplantibacillus modestisalitolerans]|uniref:Uncharacterized protein n=1 Tax=Lactiplantibacillus modestisalitolerans TaxID=1457219 RepID=A0ABV5WSJ1_9LACO|nr:hypothetical protein [Lactiplantibacillus modestisalitolerans]